MPILSKKGDVLHDIGKIYVFSNDTFYSISKVYSDTDLVFSAELNLPDSTKLSWNWVPSAVGDTSKTINDTQVKWDCRGYNTLSGTLHWKVYNNMDTGSLNVYIVDGSNKIHLIRGGYSLHDSEEKTLDVVLDMTAFTEEQKNNMYLRALPYAHVAGTTNGKYVKGYTQLTNVIAS